jgi:hypothetical protein
MSSDRRSCAVVVAATLVGCTPAAPHYGYQYQLAQQFSGGEEPESASAEARQLLATARTVAFYPPDICLNSEAGQGPSPNQRMVRASCGVLLSTLERAAERAGYEVLSWQNLRGNKRPSTSRARPTSTSCSRSTSSISGSSTTRRCSGR